MPSTALSGDPAAGALLIAALMIATYLYANLLRRRHAQERAMERSLSAIVDNYGRTGISDSFLNR